MKRIIIAVFVIALIFQLPLQAAYLTNVPQTLKQPDGTILQCYATGDEYHNWLHDANNFTIIQDPVTGFYVYAAKSGSKLVATSFIAGKVNPAEAGLQPGLNLDPEEILRLSKDRYKIPNLKGSSGFNTTGSINNIVIFIRFSDQAEYTSSPSAYSSAFNSTVGVSMGEYFKEVSGTQLAISTSFYPGTTGSTVVSYQDSHPRNYYCKYNITTNPIGYQTEAEWTDREMVLLKTATEALKPEIEATGLDYDNDNNGQVDNVCFIIQGAVEAWADLLWPHMWALYTYNVQIAGARVWFFNFQLSQAFGVSVLCHEMNHSLGFPDLYRYTNKTIDPVWQWDIMSLNINPPQHSSVYTKLKYGQWFSSVPEISTPGIYTLSPLSTDPFAGYKIVSPNISTEFFVLEYRRVSGTFEQGLPGSGLIIYRVNTQVSGNSTGPPDEVYVYRPDGTTTVDGSVSQAFFSSGAGRTSFTATSNPTCLLSDGLPGGIEITNIGTAGTTISFTVNLGSSAPVLTVLPATRSVDFAAGTTTFDVTNTGGGTMTWTAAVTTGSSWTHITSGGSGTNSGTISLSVDANPDNAVRTGVITITAAGATGSPKTVTIVQAANPPVLTLLPVSRSIEYQSVTTDFDVTNTGGGVMGWTAAVTTGSSWAHIISGASGTNSGTISVSVDANPDNAIRTGIITITAAGATGSPQTVTIVQAANLPVLNVLPSSRSLDFPASTTAFDVANTGGGTMIWVAQLSAGVTWARISGGSSGSNAGTITVDVDQNDSSALRSVEMVISINDVAGSAETVNIRQHGDLSGINLLKVENIFKVYPNPSNGKVTIQIADFRGITQKLEVLNIVGQTEMVQILSQESTTIDLSYLTKGVHFFRVTSENGMPGVIKVIKN